MASLTPDILDLRSELLLIKKQFGDSKSENTILKVKVRRMQEELCRKNKELQVLLDPEKAINRRIMAEQGTSLILKLKDQIEDMKTQLHVRDFQITKLQNKLLAARVYDKNTYSMKNACDDARSVGHSDHKSKNNFNHSDMYLNKPGDGCTGPCSPSPISEFSYALDNLQKNISKIKQNCEGQDNIACLECNMEDVRYSSRSHNSIERKSSQAAHHELQDLTSYVMQMTLELENLKTNFMKLQREKFSRSKSAEPKLGVKTYSPKLIMVHPKGITENRHSNGAPVMETSNKANGSFVVKNAFVGECKSRPRPTPMKKVETFQQTSNCRVRDYVDETDSVSEIIILEK